MSDFSKDIARRNLVEMIKKFPWHEHNLVEVTMHIRFTDDYWIWDLADEIIEVMRAHQREFGNI